MEADWSVEMGWDDPVIAVPWQMADSGARFVDLRDQPDLIGEIEEAIHRPSLWRVLETLNGAGSAVSTAKCGVWSRENRLAADENELDPGEFDADQEEARWIAGSYIDLLPLGPAQEISFASGEHWVRELAGRSRRIPLGCGRSDFVLRRASLHGTDSLGVTWFTQGCGATAELAERQWVKHLEAALPVVMSVAPGAQCSGSDRYNEARVVQRDSGE